MRTIIRDNYTPEPGDYHERIVIDETRDKQWLFDCDGVFTDITGSDIEIANEFGDKTGAAISQKFFTDTVETLNSDINLALDGLEAEIATREEADTALAGDILAERTARINADAALEQDIVEEAAARASADSALSSSVESLSSSLSSEEAARQAADAALSTAIANETSARETADTTLQSNIDGVASGLTAEATARAQADTTLQNNIDSEVSARTSADSALDARIAANTTAISNETTARQGADANLQSQIDAITASSDVKDIVGTYAQLQAYDTSTLGNNDIIKVLQDETHSNETTYYRWNATTQQFTLIGEEGPYYTKSQTDTLLNAKQDTLTAGSNIQISGSTISATDTTYSAGTGLDLTGTTFSVDTTTIATKSDLPTKTSDLTNDGADGTSTYVEADELATVATSGSYTDLQDKPTIPAAQVNSDWNASSGVAEILNKPTIPTVNNATLTVTQNGASAGTFTANSSTDTTIALTDTTYSNYTGATSQTAGTAGLVPAPAAGDETKFLSGNGAWTTVSQYALPIASANDLGGIKVGNNLTIDSTTGVLDATDTTYSNFTGTDGTTAGAAGLVPAPATTDAGKFLKADGTWDAVQAGPTVVQTTGTSTTDVMSQNATTGMVYADQSNKTRIQIGASADARTNGVAVGAYTYTAVGTGLGTAVGYGAKAQEIGSSAFGAWASVPSDGNGEYSVAVGSYSKATEKGQVDISTLGTTNTYGYNNSQYRLLSGLYDPQNDHDAATKGYVDTAIAGAEGASEINSTDWSALWQ